jgi:hypothetical protein
MYFISLKQRRYSIIFISTSICYREKWVPVTMAWRVIRLEEQPPIWRVTANILNKQSRTADKGWSSGFGVARGANNPL